MTENDSGVDRILDRLDKLDDKVESLRKELSESFVLKAVFEVYKDTHTKDIEDIKSELKDNKQNELNKPMRWIAIGGGSIGALTTLLHLLHLWGM